jgi:iron complex transport system substrate-binding protein
VLRRSLVLVATLAVALTAVAAAGSRPQASFPITIQAANGPVTIARQPARILSLSPTLTEDLFAVGAGQQVVAVDDQSDYPKQAPRTKLSGITPNAEAIAGYDPDLVIVSYDGPIIGQLQKLGMTVLLEPAIDTMAQAYEQIRQVGRATGHVAQAAKVVRTMQVKFTKAIRSVPKTHRHLRVYHELTPDYYSTTSSTFIGRIYKLFGFQNVADAADNTHSGYPQLSGEYILKANPQLVVLADSVCCGQQPATVAARPGWAQLDAVKQQRVIAVDDSIASRWGPRLVNFVAAVAAAARRG